MSCDSSEVTHGAGIDEDVPKNDFTFQNTSADVRTQPRLALDLSAFWETPGRVFVGVDYLYWHNKYGIDGLTDKTSFPSWSGSCDVIGRSKPFPCHLHRRTGSA